VEWVAGIAGPLTAMTAVLYFFGWTRTNALFGYFGVDPAILEFELADYLARAVGPAFAPAIVLILTAAVLAALNRAALRLELACLRHPVQIHGHTIIVRAPSIVLIYIGMIALWCSARVTFGLPDYLGVAKQLRLTEPIPAALALAGGAVLLSTGIRLLQIRSDTSSSGLPRAHTLARVLLVIAVLVSVFWATAVFSQNRGDALAAFINANPATQPEVTIYSEKSLRLWSATTPGPAPPLAAGEEERFRYTYTGLRLLIYANDRWVLLTGDRSARGRLTVAIIRDDDTIRVQVSND
jgi:hypothetical protein